MPESKFVLRVERLDGEPVYLRPGGSSERDLRALIHAKVAEKGVGILRTRSQVLAAIDAALAEAIHELKSDILPVV